MFTQLKQQQTEMKQYRKATRTGASTWAKLAAYFVAIAAIVVLSLIFGQTTSGVFQDPTMKNIGIAASIVVGGSSIVFLLFKAKLLKSRTQFVVAWIFLGIEIALLTLGALHAFGTNLGWEFSPFVNEAAKLAVILTFPLVMLEWLVVLSLDPDESDDRADNHSKSALAKTDRETRETLRMSDPVVEIRRAAAMTEVLGEEMARLPTTHRAMFANILHKQYGDQFEGVHLLLDNNALPNVLDQPRDQAPTAEPVPPQDSLLDKVTALGQRLTHNSAPQPAAMSTMAAEGSAAPKSKATKPMD